MGGAIANFRPVVVSNKPKRPYWIKPVLVFIITAVLTVGGYFGYQYYQKVAEKKLNKSTSVGVLNEEMAKFISLSSDNKTLFYLDPADSSLQKLNVDNFSAPAEEIAKIDFLPTSEEMVNVKWSSDQTKVYIGTLSGSLKYYYYDLVRKEHKVFDAKVIDIDFLGDKAVYIFDNGADKSINVSDDNGSNWRNVKTIGSQYYQIFTSSDGKKAAVWGLGEIGQKNLGIYNFETDKLVEAEEGIVNFVKFSPDSSKLLYSISDTSKLFTLDLSGQIKDLKAKAYLDQFVWVDNANIAYAVYAKEQMGNAYNFYRMNITDGKSTKINREGDAESDDLDNLTVANDGKTLFYTTKGELLRLSL